MKTLQEKITELNKLVLAGNALEAFERFYHPDVAMQENSQPAVVGKEANRQREIEFYGKVTGFYEHAKALEVTVGNNVTMVKWAYDYHHEDWGKKSYTQISVQHWKDDQIINEQFFYGN